MKKIKLQLLLLFLMVALASSALLPVIRGTGDGNPYYYYYYYQDGFFATSSIQGVNAILTIAVLASTVVIAQLLLKGILK